MKKGTITKLAFMGLVSGSIAVGAVGCKSGDGDKPPVEETTEETMPAESAPAAEEPEAAPTANEYSEIHDCAGKNACKGLGGCKVDAAKLQELATAAGVEGDAAGEAHDCSGKNACKGLGGCSVDADKLAKLKAAMAPAEGETK